MWTRWWRCATTRLAEPVRVRPTHRPGLPIRPRARADGIGARRAHTSNRHSRPRLPCDGDRREPPCRRGFQLVHQGMGASPIALCVPPQGGNGRRPVPGGSSLASVARNAFVSMHIFYHVSAIRRGVAAVGASRLRSREQLWRNTMAQHHLPVQDSESRVS